MFSRSLSALGHPRADDLNFQPAASKRHFCELIHWLEDNTFKLRSSPNARKNLYPPHDNESLPLKSISKYLIEELKSPDKDLIESCLFSVFSETSKMDVADGDEDGLNEEGLTPEEVFEQNLIAERTKLVESILQEALHVAYTRSLETDSSQPMEQGSDIDFSSPDFLAFIERLATKLQVASHPDPSVRLDACLLVIENHLQSKESSANGNEPQKRPPRITGPNSHPARPRDVIGSNEPGPARDTSLSLDSIPLGISDKSLENDPGLRDAVKIARLLGLVEMRDLQTSIDEALVKIQSITANPVTSTQLGAATGRGNVPQR